MAIEGLGVRSGAPGAMAAELDQLGFQVNRDNVLQVYGLIAAEAQRMGAVLSRHAGSLQVDICGGDPVSFDARDAFNAKLATLRDECQGYVNALRAAADRLKSTAISYGFTEDEVKEAFGAAYEKTMSIESASSVTPVLDSVSAQPPGTSR